MRIGQALRSRHLDYNLGKWSPLRDLSRKYDFIFRWFILRNGNPSLELNQEAIFLGLAQMGLEASAEEVAAAAIILTQLQQG